jgi:hypothetical protein
LREEFFVLRDKRLDFFFDNLREIIIYIY